MDTLLLFKVYEFLHIDSLLDSVRATTLLMDVPSFVKYSLPDGLWVYAFTYFLVSLWKFDEDIGREKYLIMGLPLLLGGGAEVLQLFFVQLGTFDFQDLFISVLAFIAGYIAAKPSKLGSEGEVRVWLEIGRK